MHGAVPNWACLFWGKQMLSSELCAQEMLLGQVYARKEGEKILVGRLHPLPQVDGVPVIGGDGHQEVASLFVWIGVVYISGETACDDTGGEHSKPQFAISASLTLWTSRGNQNDKQACWRSEDQELQIEDPSNDCRKGIHASASQTVKLCDPSKVANNCWTEAQAQKPNAFDLNPWRHNTALILSQPNRPYIFIAQASL
eukprot:1159744-Pelagomonas_calceolata.AAC.7